MAATASAAKTGGQASIPRKSSAWMPTCRSSCRNCDRRELDFGGCRCQALLLAGDAAATDPVCILAPERSKVDAILAAVAETSLEPDWIYRPNPA